MSNLAAIIDRVETVIDDATNVDFSTDIITEGIRQALSRYSFIRPLKAVGTITVSSSGREIDTSSLTGLIDIERIWTPYTASDPEHPPNWRGFEYWSDLQLLYFPEGDEPQADDVIRVFYTKLQTIEDLDSATSTTFPDEDESLIVTGASGYSVLPRGRSSTEQVMLADQVPLSEQIIKWARGQLGEFQLGLDRITAQQANQLGSIIELPKLDRWDRDSQGWA